MTFKIGNSDYSKYVEIGTYNINSKKITKTWEDANGKTHSMVVRNKISGTLNVFFRTLDQLNQFKTDLENNYNLTSNTYLLTISVNNTGVDVSKDFFVTYEDLVRNVDGTRQDFIDLFTLTIEEP